MTLVARILAQVVDLIVGVLCLMVTFAWVLPFLSQFISNNTVLAVIALVMFIGITSALQYPFLTNHQTIGKAFFGLRIVSTMPERPLTTAVIVQREIFCKLISCYFICIPLIFGREGGHDEATRTTVERAPVKAGRKRITKKAR